MYSIFGRKTTIHTVIYGVYIRFWPTLCMLYAVCCIVSAHTHTHNHTHTHVQPHAHTHTYTHIHTQSGQFAGDHVPLPICGCLSVLQPFLMPHTHTHTYTHTQTHIHARTQTHTHADTRTHTHTYTRTHTYTHIHTRTHAHTHTHTLTYTHAHTHTHIHTYTHIHTQGRWEVTLAGCAAWYHCCQTPRTDLSYNIKIGLARIVYTHRIWPYVWWFPSKKHHIYNVYTYKCMVLANPIYKHSVPTSHPDRLLLIVRYNNIKTSHAALIHYVIRVNPNIQTVLSSRSRCTGPPPGNYPPQGYPPTHGNFHLCEKCT